MRFALVVTLSFAVSSSLFAADQTCASRWKEVVKTPVEAKYKSLVGKCDEDLKVALRQMISTNKNLGYDGARRVMYNDLDKEENKLCSVYTEMCVSFNGGMPNSSEINCEHTWPQSKGAVGIAKADLHHLYTVDSKTNSTRGNNPFCETASGGNATETMSASGKNQLGVTCFEPKGSHKGTVARSMLYFSVRYDKSIDAEQEGFFRDWNAREVTEKEMTRNNKIEKAQNNRNPFIDHPEFVELISDF